MNPLELHPLCTLFPRITGAEFEALVADIKANGLREPIIIHDGMILDGGNRYRACIEAGVEPAVMKFGGGNLVSYVLSANLHRRHLSAMQSAAIVASAQDWANAQTVGGNGSNQHKRQSGKSTELQTVASRQAQSGASDKTQRMADKIAKADPELAKALGRGEVSPSDAVEKVTGKRPGAKPPPKPPEPEDDGGYEDNLTIMRNSVDALSAENNRLKDKIANYEAVLLDDEKAGYIGRLDDLTNENKKLEALNQALVDARDRVMRENVSLRKQCDMNSRKIKKLEAAK